ncbi:hypothetical protein EVAR_74113_1 [Eumeta japonica]|uniref:DUF5641 domain-containing protein n=1 Tax=Eumeta variegata TaxID=151549 RepID=A0A4C1TU45_EUMVA|nr:hypothetical protein EVAR_74113_1 [Eumeta japonica]
MVTCEVRRHVLVTNKVVDSYNYLNIDYFSNWKRLYRAVATFILYMTKLKATGPLSAESFCVNYDMIQQAQRYLFKVAQETCFNREIVSLKHDESVERVNYKFPALHTNHLLLGSCDGYKPIYEDAGNLRLRWQKTQLFADQFRKRWLKEYVPIISRRIKWFAKVPPISIGAIVIVADENLPKRCWPKGKVIDTVVAKDGQVRRVTVKTQIGTMQRPVTKVAVLNIGEDHE